MKEATELILDDEEDFSRQGARVAAVILDIASKWLNGFGSISKNAQETRKAITRYLGPQVSPQHIYSDNSKEIKKAVRDLDWDERHDTSTPNRPSTNGIIERAVRTIKEGISALLIQSGLSPDGGLMR